MKNATSLSITKDIKEELINLKFSLKQKSWNTFFKAILPIIKNNRLGDKKYETKHKRKTK